MQDMASIIFEVKYYRVQLSNGTIGVYKRDRTTENITIAGYINCLDASSDWKQELILYFIPDGIELPDGFCNIAEKRGGAFHPVSQMGLYLDILRNEKPVFAGMDDRFPNASYLTTYPEPVGERE
jgi:hypothetical protein